MQARALLALMAGCLIAADRSEVRGPQTFGVESHLDGTWKVVSVDVAGAPEKKLTADQAKHSCLEVRGDRMVLRENGKLVGEVRLTIDASKQPPCISMPGPCKGFLGIYKRQGRELTLALNSSPEYPDDFSPDRAMYCVVLRRVQP